MYQRDILPEQTLSDKKKKTFQIRGAQSLTHGPNLDCRAMSSGLQGSPRVRKFGVGEAGNEYCQSYPAAKILSTVQPDPYPSRATAMQLDQGLTTPLPAVHGQIRARPFCVCRPSPHYACPTCWIKPTIWTADRPGTTYLAYRRVGGKGEVGHHYFRQKKCNRSHLPGLQYRI